MDSNTSKIRLYCLFVFVAYYYLLKIGYFTVYNIYEHVGFEYQQDSFKQIISTTIFFIFIAIFFLLKKMDSFTWSVTTYVFSIMTIPILVYYEYNPTMNISYLIGHLSVIIFLILFLNSSSKTKARNVIKKVEDKRVLYFLVLLMICPFIITYGFNFNFDIFTLASEAIYDVRYASIENSNVLTRYFEGWLSKAICPILLVYGLIKKDKKIILFSAIILLYIFLISAHKSLFLGTLTILFFYFIKGYERKILSFMILICSLISISEILTYLDIPNPITAIVTYRYLFVPVEVGSYYFEFFDEKFTYWSQSPFNPFVFYKYNSTPAYVIGDYYYNDPTLAANTGIISDGFMNFGFLGILINVLIFVFIVYLWKRKRISEKYFGVFVSYLIAFQNSSLPTIFLTHGLIIVFLLFTFFELEET